MNIIDLILLFLLFLFALRGYFTGLFRESFSLVGLFAGFIVAVRYGESVAALWKGYSNFSPIVLKAITFVALFFLVYFTCSLIGWLLHHSAKFLFLQTVNRAGGVVLGMGKGAAILALIVFFLNSFPVVPQKIKKQIHDSYLAPPLHQFAQRIIRFGKVNLLKRAASQGSSEERLIFLGGYDDRRWQNHRDS
ncbi:MAG: CvpA family protein [Candidatus Binatia bacterium]